MNYDLITYLKAAFRTFIHSLKSQAEFCMAQILIGRFAK